MKFQQKNLISDIQYIWDNAENLLDKRWVIEYLKRLIDMGERIYKIQEDEELQDMLIKYHELLLNLKI